MIADQSSILIPNYWVLTAHSKALAFTATTLVSRVFSIDSIPYEPTLITGAADFRRA